MRRFGIKRRKAGRNTDIMTPILLTLISIGPIGTYFMETADGSYDKLSRIFIMSIFATALSALVWGFYLFSYFEDKDE
jgi:hypothetical protein